MIQPTEDNPKTEDKTRSSLNKLAIILKIVFEDNQDIFLNKPEEVNVDLLKKLSDSFIAISTLFQEAIGEWFDSDSEAFDFIKQS
jgi:hypothetical protein